MTKEFMKIVNLAVKIIEQIRFLSAGINQFLSPLSRQRVCHLCMDNIDFANTFSCSILQLQ